MPDTLKFSIRKSCLLASGLPELDYSYFTRHRIDLPNGVRAVLTKGAMKLRIAGYIQMKEVVLKTINEQFADGLNDVRRQKLYQYFNREAGIWRHTGSHPNILELYGFVMVPNEPFPSLISPYYPAGNLRAFVEDKKNQSMPSQQRIKLICDISRGLDFLHNLSPVVVHRDIRAKNVLVRFERGRLSAVIIDFGSSKLSDPELFSIIDSTRIDFVEWCPPEYVRDDLNYRNPTAYGDIWSLACTCLETFTAQNPYPEWYNTREQLKRGTSPLELWKDFPGISDALWEFMKLCWTLDPKERPSAKEAASRLRTLAECA